MVTAEVTGRSGSRHKHHVHTRSGNSRSRSDEDLKSPPGADCLKVEANQLGHADVNTTAGYLGRRQAPTRAATVMTSDQAIRSRNKW